MDRGLIHEELSTLAAQEETSVKEKVEQATLLLEAPKEDISIFTEKLGMTRQFEQSEKAVAKSNKVTAYKNIYNKEVYTAEQIMTMCNTYDLKILECRHYKGKINMEMATVIKDFTEKNNINITMGNFLILSTRESFYEGYDNKQDNCLLFFREGERTYGNVSKDEVLILVHTWGDPITSSRRNRFLFYGFSDGDKLPSSAGTAVAIALFIFSFFCGIGLGVFAATLGAVFFFVNSINEKYYDKTWNSIERE